MFGLNNEWLWVALIAAVLFGAGNIPKLARNLGEGIREFKKSVNSTNTEKVTAASGRASDAKEK